MEVRKLFLEYLYNSPSCPYAPVDDICVRDKYQSDSGDLPHIHLVIYIILEQLNSKKAEKLDNLIRASVCGFVKADEVQHLIDDGIFKKVDDVYEI